MAQAAKPAPHLSTSSSHEIFVTWFTIGLLRELRHPLERRAKSGSRSKRRNYGYNATRTVLYAS
jgi:hypothetical protein